MLRADCKITKVAIALRVASEAESNSVCSKEHSRVWSRISLNCVALSSVYLAEVRIRSSERDALAYKKRRKLGCTFLTPWVQFWFKL